MTCGVIFREGRRDENLWVRLLSEEGRSHCCLEKLAEHKPKIKKTCEPCEACPAFPAFSQGMGTRLSWGPADCLLRVLLPSGAVLPS